MNQYSPENKSPILIDFISTLKTPRLEIRPIRPGDGSCLYSLLSENFNFLSKWITWLKKPLSQDECEILCRRYYADFILRHELHFLILVRGMDTAIGSITLSEIDWSIPKASVGYWGSSSHSGNGYITEAAGALACFAFDCLKIKRLTILCDDKNEKSWRIPERLGFTHELQARGLIDSVDQKVLCLTRQYVRWDAKGLESFKTI